MQNLPYSKMENDSPKRYIRIDDSIHADVRNSSYFLEAQEEFNEFGPISRLTIFVGANSSGKSRFLRSLLKTSHFTESSVSISKFQESLEKIHEYATNNSIDARLQESHASFRVPFVNNPENRIDALNKAHNDLLNERPLDNSSEHAYFFRKQDAEFIYNSIMQYWSLGEISILKQFVGQKLKLFEVLEEAVRNRGLLVKAIGSQLIYFDRNHNYILESMYQSIQPLTEILKEIQQNPIQKFEPSLKIYIPILRTANSIYSEKNAKVSEKVYENSVALNYEFDTSTESLRISTGLDLYKQIRKTRNSVKKDRKNFEAFEDFLEENFFQGREIDIVARDTDDPQEAHILIHFSDEENEDRKLHNLGDGIQSIILLMYPIFTAPDNSWIFIEEPEINLHPGLQRIFIEQILRNETIKKKNLRIFLTTHSNHLLDLSLEFGDEVSIFTFDRKITDGKPRIRIKNVKSQDTDILKLLGVNNSSVFMANCSIWVEGISDRIYIRAYLKAYMEAYKDCEKFKEDLHYAFFEYAGSNVSHYVFLSPDELEEEGFSKTELKKIKAQFLSNKIFLIADRDEHKDGKHNFLTDQAGNSKNFSYAPLEVREIENLLSAVQLKKYLPELTPKIEASEIARKKIQEADYKDKYLGKYLFDKFKNTLPKTFKAQSGTLSTRYKIKLAEIIAENIQWTEMSKDAQELTEKVYEFIKQSNSHQV